MVKKLVLAVCLLVGCSTSQPKIVSGTHISFGAYIPWNGELYGLELMQYTSGVVVTVPTNMCYEIERNHSVTNEWGFGLLKSGESGMVQVKLK